MQRQTHQLAAIMFTDIVGYTAMMGKDEEKALQLLEQNRRMQRPIIEALGGVWIKEMGDGVLATFRTVSDAILAAIRIQQQCKSSNDFELRIGIHLAEIVLRDHDVFGDGVNIASRIQALAPPGGIYVTEAIQKNIANRKEFSTRFIKSEVLKNIADPVLIYEIIPAELQTQPEETFIPTFFRRKFQSRLLWLTAVSLALATALVYWFRQQDKTTVSTIDTIAVLPFRDISQSHDYEFLADAMMESIISEFYKVRSLNTKSSQTMQKYKGTKLSIPEIARELNVEALLEGSITIINGQVRVQTTLFDANENRLWSEPFEYREEDIIKLQKEIASRVTMQINVTLSPTETKQLKEHAGKVDPVAYAHYLRGKSILNNLYLDSDKLKEAIDQFSKARERDPDFADAWAASAHCYLLRDAREIWTFEEAWQLAQPLNETARMLNPDLPRVYLNEAIHFRGLGDWTNTRQTLAKARSLAPNHPDVLSNLISYFLMAGQKREALDAALKFMETSPFENRAYENLYTAYFYNNDYKQSLVTIEKSKKLFPDYLGSEIVRSLDHCLLKEPSKALEAWKQGESLMDSTQLESLAGLGVFFREQAGHHEEALKLAKKYSLKNQPAAYSLSLLYYHLALSTEEEFLDYLESASHSRNWNMTLQMASNPVLERYRSIPRFEQIRKTMTIPPAMSTEDAP